jgi:hypothetical protein
MTTSISDLGSHPHQPVFWLRSIKHQSFSAWHHPSSTTRKGLCALIRSLVLLLADLFGSSFTMQPNQSPEPMRGGAVSSASRLDVGWSRMAQLRSLGIIHIYGNIITEIGLSELQRDEVSPRSVYGRQQARAKLDASEEQGVELGHDIFYLS